MKNVPLKVDCATLASNENINTIIGQKETGNLFSLKDIDDLEVLGWGFYGKVNKVFLKPIQKISASKKIIITTHLYEDVKPKERLAERELKLCLRALRKLNSAHIIDFFGGFIEDGHVYILMEYMEYGSLEKLYKKYGPINELVVSDISHQLIGGLIDLEKSRDGSLVVRISPSSILINNEGQVKLAEFNFVPSAMSSINDDNFRHGIFNESGYFSPERLLGGDTNYSQDAVWSVGLVAMEIAMAKYPLQQYDTIMDSALEIIHKPSPTLPSDAFSASFCEFCRLALLKDPKERPSPTKLAETEFIKQSEKFPNSLQAFLSNQNAT
jgi:mitogen-activated protein kinase kinase